MTAIEIVWAIRIGDTSNMKDPWDVKQYTDEEAEQLIIEFAEAKEAEAYKEAMATIPDGGASCKMCMSNIKKECADRAVAWAKKWAEFPMGNHGEGALCAEIMGEE